MGVCVCTPVIHRAYNAAPRATAAACACALVRSRAVGTPLVRGTLSSQHTAPPSRACALGMLQM
ncbi:hypothetical protein EON67_08180 [archaeon]|nr:MAG: hypothetical protein EON67_08180 [archaeon]